MNARVKIGDKDIDLLASTWTWIVYKNIFKRDWNADRDKSLTAIQKAYLFESEHANLTNEQFKKLSKEEQDAYWKGVNENTVDLSFSLDTIYAMAVAGGFQGTQKDLFEKLPPKELSPDSEFMKTFTKLSGEFNIEIKKNNQANP